MKKLLLLCLMLVLCLSLCSCEFLQDVLDSTAHEEAENKVFEFDGLSIELTTAFLRMVIAGTNYDFIVGDGTVTVMGMKLENDALSDLTATEFAEFFCTLMEESTPTPVTHVNEIPTAQYVGTDDDGEQQTIAMMFYKATDCFWLVCFGAESDSFDDVYGEICHYATSVTCV